MSVAPATNSNEQDSKIKDDVSKTSEGEKPEEKINITQSLVLQYDRFELAERQNLIPQNEVSAETRKVEREFSEQAREWNENKKSFILALPSEEALSNYFNNDFMTKIGTQMSKNVEMGEKIKNDNEEYIKNFSKLLLDNKIRTSRKFSRRLFVVKNLSGSLSLNLDAMQSSSLIPLPQSSGLDDKKNASRNYKSLLKSVQKDFKYLESKMTEAKNIFDTKIRFFSAKFKFGIFNFIAEFVNQAFDQCKAVNLNIESSLENGDFYSFVNYYNTFTALFKIFDKNGWWNIYSLIAKNYRSEKSALVLNKNNIIFSSQIIFMLGVERTLASLAQGLLIIE